MNKTDNSNIETVNEKKILGWDEHFETELSELLNGKRLGMKFVGRITNVQRNQFLVSDGSEEVFCTVAGRFKRNKQGEFPVFGDWVVVKDTLISKIIPRKNLLTRGEAGSQDIATGVARRKQAIAANIDTVFIVSGLDQDFNDRRLERYLTLVYNCNLNPVIVLTKADLHDDPEAFKAEAEEIALGVPVVLCSKTDGRGQDELEVYLREGQTVAMIGSSGVGKSTLANMLYGEDIQKTGVISESVGKGKHTTTMRELIRMPQGGLLMDNPGIREVAFSEESDGLDTAFEDIQELAEQCRFADCTHDREPGCAVRQAVDNGELEPSRLENYQKMKKEMQFLAERRGKSADRIEKERWKGVSQLARKMKKEKAKSGRKRIRLV